MIRSLRYPLRPTAAQEATLVRWLGMLCDLYNGALQERRDAWRIEGRGVSKYDQTRSLTEIRAEVPGWDTIPCEVARSALDRLDKAFKAFFRRCKAGEKPGYPRFRSRRRYDSFSLGYEAARAKWLVRDSAVKIPFLGYVKFHQYRPLRGEVVDVKICREADRWWVIFDCDIGAAPEKLDLTVLPLRRQVGIDVGLTSLATLSTGEAIANPQHARRARAKLRNVQQVLVRKKKGSKSRKRALVRLQRAHIRVHNQRLDTARKIAYRLVWRYSLIAVEDLNIRGMVHGNLARSIHDAGWRMLLTAIACKAEEAGVHVVAVDPRGTSQRCSRCGATVRKDLSVRTHACPHCGLVIDRDHNAALNILALGRSALGQLAIPRVTDEAATA